MAMTSLVMVPPSPLWCSSSTSSKLRSFNPPHLGLGPFTRRNGLIHLNSSITRFSRRRARKGKCRGGMAVRASFFGVGAPEALVIGVVALLVFGPKGLAEVARNLGKTLHAFQPTIRELQDVSREFKSTLEREIGLDEISSPIQTTSSSRTNMASPPPSNKNPRAVSDVDGASSPNRALSTEEYLKFRGAAKSSCFARTATATICIHQKRTRNRESAKRLAAVMIPPSNTSVTPSHYCGWLSAADKVTDGAMPPPVEPEKDGK